MVLLACLREDSICKFFFVLNQFSVSFRPAFTDSHSYSFAIGYVYSFVAAGVFYWVFNRFFPHTESMLDRPETGEDIIAAQDAKNVEERRGSWTEHKPNIVSRMFSV